MPGQAAGHGPGDDAAVGRQLVQPDLSGVALGDRVRRQEAELPSLPQQRAGPQEEVGAEVGTAPLPSCQVLHQIVPVVRRRGCL